MAAHLWYFALDAATATVMALIGVRFLIARPFGKNALLIAALSAGAICHLVLARVDYAFFIPDALQFDITGPAALLMNIGRNAVPGLFMLLCHALFQEPARFPRWLIALFAVQLFLEDGVTLFTTTVVAETLLSEALPGALQTLFAGYALYWTIVGWPADLVENRRRARWLFVAAIGLLLVVFSFLYRVASLWWPTWHYSVHVVNVAITLAVASSAVFAMMRLDVADWLDPGHARARPDAPAPADDSDRFLSALERVLGEERVYREPGLSIRALADRLKLPEYRLRRLINERLGYRNFNAFLHEYRIREACELLADPANDRLPVLTIALSVGYGSINTFNRAFRDLRDTTPSAFRAAARAGAADPDAA